MMPSIYIPVAEENLFSCLMVLNDQLFKKVLSTHEVSILVGQGEGLHIQFDSDVLFDIEIWQAGEVEIRPPVKCHFRLVYLNSFVEIDKKQMRRNTAFISLNTISQYEQTDCWLDEHGLERSLFQRESPEHHEIFAIKHWHLAWFLLAIAYDFSFDDALVLSRAAMNVSRGTWPNHIRHFPSVVGNAYYRHAIFPRVDMQRFQLYPIIDSYEWANRLIRQYQVSTIQLRIKDKKQSKRERQIQAVCRLASQFNTQLFINDYWESAVRNHAYGLHLGQDDFYLVDFDRLKSSKIRVGISTHGYYEILKAESFCPSYIAFGHIFLTKTKSMLTSPIGLSKLTLYQQLADSIYFNHQKLATVAIGGIDLWTAKSVLATGVDSLAVISAVTESNHLGQTLSAFQASFSQILG